MTHHNFAPPPLSPPLSLSPLKITHTHTHAPFCRTGIPYSIAGSAKVINVKVGEYLATFQDPIKSILSTEIHKEARVMVTRK